MNWKEFIKPTKKILIILVILFFATLFILSLTTSNSPIQILKIAFEVIPIQGCISPQGGAELCSYSVPRILFALPVYIILYILSCVINYYTKKE